MIISLSVLWLLMLQAGCDAEGDAAAASGCLVLLFSCTLILSSRFSSRMWSWSGINSRGGTEADCYYLAATNRCCCWFFLFRLSNPLLKRIVSDFWGCYFSERKRLQETECFRGPIPIRKAWTGACFPCLSWCVSEVLPSSSFFPASAQNNLWNKHPSRVLPQNTLTQWLSACSIRPPWFSRCLRQLIWLIMLLTPRLCFSPFVWMIQSVTELQLRSEKLWHKRETPFWRQLQSNH